MKRLIVILNIVIIIYAITIHRKVKVIYNNSIEIMNILEKAPEEMEIESDTTYYKDYKYRRIKDDSTPQISFDGVNWYSI